MLVLTRREGQGIRIGPDVVLTVVKIRGSQVRLGIQAAPEVKIMRPELETQIATAEKLKSRPESRRP